MSQTAEAVRYRCPVCLLNGRDPLLRWDERTGQFFCQYCCFTGGVKAVEQYYKVMRSKYRQLKTRVRAKRI